MPPSVKLHLRRHRALIFSAIAMLFVAMLALFVSSAHVPAIDVLVSQRLQAIDQSWLKALMLAISLVGYQPWATLIVVLAVLAVGSAINWRAAFYLLTLTLAQALLNIVLKIVVARPRPTAPLINIITPQQGQSFPSGHVMFYTVFFGVLGYLAWQHIRHAFWRRAALVVCSAMVVLVGPSRIIIGAHWFTDVLAGYLLGFVFLAWEGGSEKLEG